MQVNTYVYMKFIKHAVSLLNKAYQPIKDNASFFFLHVPYRYISIIRGVAYQQPQRCRIQQSMVRVVSRPIRYMHHSHTNSSKSSPMDSCFFVYHRILHKPYRPILLG